MKLSVVIPARNEADCIHRTLAELETVLWGKGIEHEIIVVDDGSTDGTRGCVESMHEAFKHIRCVPTSLAGFGGAVKTGLMCAQGDAIAIMMADGADDPKDLLMYWHVFTETGMLAFGTRWMRGGKVVGYPPFKRKLNRIGNRLIMFLLHDNYDDWTNAFKLYPRWVIEKMHPIRSTGFELLAELPIRAAQITGYRFSVWPNAWKNRKNGQSKFHMHEVSWAYISTILRLWWNG